MLQIPVFRNSRKDTVFVKHTKKLSWDFLCPWKLNPTSVACPGASEVISKKVKLKHLILSPQSNFCFSDSVQERLLSKGPVTGEQRDRIQSSTFAKDILFITVFSLKTEKRKLKCL